MTAIQISASLTLLQIGAICFVVALLIGIVIGYFEYRAWLKKFHKECCDSWVETTGFVPLTDEDKRTIKKYGVERASDLLGIPPDLLVKSIKLS